MADFTNATLGQKDKGKAEAIEKKERNQRRCILQVSIFLSILTFDFQNDVVCADFFQSTLNGHHYFLCTIVAALLAAEFPLQ
jgi:hypothetical protein